MSIEINNFYERVFFALKEDPGVHGSQARIAKKLKISSNAVHLWKKKFPNLDNLLNISRISGVSINWLITGKNDILCNVGLESLTLAEKVHIILTVFNEIEKSSEEDWQNMIETIEVDLRRRQKLREIGFNKSVALYEEREYPINLQNEKSETNATLLPID